MKDCHRILKDNQKYLATQRKHVAGSFGTILLEKKIAFEELVIKKEKKKFIQVFPEIL